ncbi:hypothetical protein ANN_27139 [Periplaneta americana]|uniref:Uncharacterized protein n=1 Tax=Periplaneta americana TaxID=6978 RepID=A0ABQ8RXB2_PERAM|nr:hypothetical protein ANN_27139 [Periplaneta americana]
MICIVAGGWEVLLHPPHSPDLSSCDYDLIQKMKEPLRDVRFRTVPDILQSETSTEQELLQGYYDFISLATSCKQRWLLH